MSKNVPLWCISFPISLLYILVKSSWKSEQKYQSYRCMNICIKMWMKTWMYECFHSHFYANFQVFFEGKLKQQIQLYTANFLYGFNGGPVLLDCIKFSQMLSIWLKPDLRLLCPPVAVARSGFNQIANAFFPKLNRPLTSTDVRKVGKSLAYLV